MSQNSLTEIISNNYAKIKNLRDNGIDPFPHRFAVTHKIAEARKFPAETPVVCAGRLMLMRVMGKATFAHIKDGTGKIQIYVKKDAVGEAAYEIFKKNNNVGDFLGVEGKLFLTHTNELTINVEKITILSKAVRPLPEKWHGLTDPETRYRERYLDLISNEDVRNIFIKRAQIISTIRRVLDGDGYLEVETPVLLAQAGGASARPFITFHNMYKSELYMRIATELPLKKLVIGGYDGVYEIGRIFRNEGIDTRHNPEFTTLEAYRAYTDYNGMAQLVEQIFLNCAELMGVETIDYNGMKINIKPPFTRVSLPEAWKAKTGSDIHEILSGKAFNRTGLCSLAARLHIEHGEDTPSAKIFERIFDEHIQAGLEQPTFVMDYPTAITPLAKCKAGDESIVERFEFFAGHEEVANAYTELNDPEDQKGRLLEQLRQRDEEKNSEADILDESFIEAMEYGMPPMGGIGIGIDRLTMLFSGKPSIREVILFPLLKPTAPQQ
ncbi:MAG: lysine--tRNA ligase [Elusimicrobia bacterium RIFOXYA12_FULL_51_18]|nr:MAG: lysine--tRNA ligase [Elusimicrobia bacterium RIFOXYA12_FULL_51_18]OGS28840.1 MAG: lysine--tRNA ligase [Elusimicrobia bacterium RIFOXYA2_FULL_53_38]